MRWGAFTAESGDSHVLSERRGTREHAEEVPAAKEEEQKAAARCAHGTSKLATISGAAAACDRGFSAEHEPGNYLREDSLGLEAKISTDAGEAD